MLSYFGKIDIEIFLKCHIFGHPVASKTVWKSSQFLYYD